MTYTVAVRSLCEFVAKQGDLDQRFTPSPTAQEGVAGHLLVASRRGDDYESEINLTGEFGPLRVRGRADGYDAGENRLEEIKTFRGKLDGLPANHRHLHWAQAKVYGHLLCQERRLSQVDLALVYLDIVDKQETVLNRLYSAQALKHHFEALCGRFLAWAEQELAHRERRDVSLQALAFPYAAFRLGQRSLAEAVYKTTRADRALAAQAPTGIGKTIATLFPALKAAPVAGLDKLFFLTAKTSGRRVALDALDQLRSKARGTPALRIIELVAKDKACQHPDKACHGESCPLALSFYDKLPAARQEALSTGDMDKAALARTALKHQVCPYFLGLDLLRWCDVVVGDYNHYFDSTALLPRLTATNQWRVGILVDEAHNLVERARKMYSASLEQIHLKVLRQSAGAPLKKKLDTLNRYWNRLHKHQTTGYAVHTDISREFIVALQGVTAAIIDHMTEHPTQSNAQLQGFYFGALHFLRMAEVFDTHSLFDIALSAGANARRPTSTLSIRNLIPAPFLSSRFTLAASTTLFSATLSPTRFYSDTLGLPADTAWIDIDTPFEASQLSVRVVRRISTRYRDRQASLLPMTDLMADQYRKQPGNYLVFLSSFDYLDKLADLFKTRHPDILVWEQSRAMNEQRRERFLACFTESGLGIGFAVLGGAFAEGIDLPGRRLIGAFIATLGLPQVNAVNEQIRRRMNQAFGDGFEYTYLYPGIRKVVQAAGRVIRTQTDCGVLYLMDDRYGQEKVRKLLPPWWRITLD